MGGTRLESFSWCLGLRYLSWTTLSFYTSSNPQPYYLFFRPSEPPHRGGKVWLALPTLGAQRIVLPGGFCVFSGKSKDSKSCFKEMRSQW